MEHIPAWHAAKVGLRLPAEIVRTERHAVWGHLDLTLFAPGRSPYLFAAVRFGRTLDPERARSLQPGDSVEVVMIEVSSAERYGCVETSLPADPAWLTWNNETVRRLARHIRESGETDQLPILADALEDAGCTDAALLAHCRDPQSHGTRSWAVELLATQA